MRQGLRVHLVAYGIRRALTREERAERHREKCRRRSARRCRCGERYNQHSSTVGCLRCPCERFEEAA